MTIPVGQYRITIEKAGYDEIDEVIVIGIGEGREAFPYPDWYLMGIFMRGNWQKNDLVFQQATILRNYIFEFL
jgi:hypothetical protein